MLSASLRAWGTAGSSWFPTFCAAHYGRKVAILKTRRGETRASRKSLFDDYGYSVERAIKPAKRKKERDSRPLVLISEIRAFSRVELNAREERTRRDPRGITRFHSPPPRLLSSPSVLFLFNVLRSSKNCHLEAAYIKRAKRLSSPC